MKPLLIAYATNEGIRLMNREDARRLTHVNLAFGIIRDGLLSLERLTIRDSLPRLRAWNPALKIVLSVGGWGAGGFSEMAATAAGREAFAASCREAMDTHALDGIDIDWEYPCSSAAGILSSPEDRENFTLLMRVLRKAAGEKIISIAAGVGHYFVRDTQMDLVAQECDYVQLMTYDLRSGFCHQAGHHTALDASAGDETGMTVRRGVQLFQDAGVPREKIVIGAAFYARRWDGVPDIHHGLLQQADSVGNSGPGYTTLLNEYIDKNGWTAYWDEDAQAPFLFNGSQFISYDDPRSLELKCRYLKREGLLGIMYWEHRHDSTHSLLKVMAEALNREA